METETLITPKDRPSFFPSSETITQKHLLLQRLQAPSTPELLNDDVEMKDSTKISESSTITTVCSETSMKETSSEQNCSLTSSTTSTTETPVVSTGASPRMNEASNTIVCKATSSISTEGGEIKSEIKDTVQESTLPQNVFTLQTNIVQPVNAQPLNAQPVNAQPVNAQPVNAQIVNAQPANAQPVNAGIKRPSIDNTNEPNAKKHKLSTENNTKTILSVNQIKVDDVTQKEIPVVTTISATPTQQQLSPSSLERTIVVSTEQQQQQNGSPQELTPTTRRLSSSSSGLASPRTSMEGITEFDVGEQPASVRRKVCLFRISLFLNNFHIFIIFVLSVECVNKHSTS